MIPHDSNGDDRDSTSGAEAVSRDRDLRLRAQEILCRVEMDRMMEKQYLVSVIRKLGSLNHT